MSEMVDRVKGAIMSSARDCGVSFSGGEYVARAAIAAMREPTPEMIETARKYGLSEHMFKPIWQSVIDAEIAEKEAK